MLKRVNPHHNADARGALRAGECHFYACFLSGTDGIGPDGES